MRKFKEYVLVRDSVEELKAMSGTQNSPGNPPPDIHVKTLGSKDDESPAEQEFKALIYKATKLMLNKDAPGLMSFLDANGDEDIRSLVDKAKQKRGGLNNEKGLGNLGSDDMERIKTPDADRAGSPEDMNDNGGGGY